MYSSEFVSNWVRKLLHVWYFKSFCHKEENFYRLRWKYKNIHNLHWNLFVWIEICTLVYILLRQSCIISVQNRKILYICQKNWKEDKFGSWEMFEINFILDFLIRVSKFNIKFSQKIRSCLEFVLQKAI